MATEKSEELSKRIDQICADKQLTYNKLAKMFGISSTTFYQITSGKTKQLSVEVLIKFYQLLDVDITWLATGEGEMYAKPPALSNKSADNGAFGGKVVEQLETRIEELKDQVDNLKYIVSLQRQMLEQTNGAAVSVGKPEGAIYRPLSASMSFEGMMQQYKQAVLGYLPTSSFFLASGAAKLVAPRSFK